MRRRVVHIALLGLAVAAVDTGPAWAYLDPGTGSMMLQVLLGGIAGAMVVGKLYWHRFREFVRSRFSGKPTGNAQVTHGGTSSRTDVLDD